MARKRRKPRRKRKPAWTEAHVRRLFWRAGFGATAEEARRWAGRGRRATLDWIVGGDGPAELRGPAPSADGKPLDPANVPGHGVIWWLDRMVRSTRPLEEKMTLLWHDHFATRDVERPLMLRQNEMFRRRALGGFDDLLRDATLDPALQIFLSLMGSHKRAPNENFARELMELFTIGTGYTEDDVREASRALTGFVGVYENGRVKDVRFDPERWDPGTKTIFGRTGAWKWDDVLRLCLEHPGHPGFLVTKVWDYFIPAPIPEATRKKLATAYARSGRRIAPLVRSVLDHEKLYADLDRPSQVKWPAVFLAGQLRYAGAAVTRTAWSYSLANMGQTVFQPPSVAGWDWNDLWLSSNAMRARFLVAGELVSTQGPLAVAKGSVEPGLSAADHLGKAIAAVGVPHVTRSTRLVLERMLSTSLAMPEAMHREESVRRRHAEQVQRAVRHLLISGPENQVC
jgi:uncharacterized protein (DUF1800 family)